METDDALIRISKPMNKQSKNEQKKRVTIFERCVGGITNFSFDSELLEQFYSQCCFPQDRIKFMYSVLYMAFVYLTWFILIFCLEYDTEKNKDVSEDDPYLHIGLFVTAIIGSLILFVITLKSVIFQKYRQWVYLFSAFLYIVIIFGTLAKSVGRFTTYFNFSLICQLIMIAYCVIPLKLWKIMLGTLPISVAHLLIRMTWQKPKEWDGVGGMVCGHIFVHFVGILMFIMSQVRNRSTFLKLGYSSLMRQELKKEQQIRDDMIRSLMPGQVAKEVMQDIGENDRKDSDEASRPMSHHGDDLDGEMDFEGGSGGFDGGARKRKNKRRGKKRSGKDASVDRVYFESESDEDPVSDANANRNSMGDVQVKVSCIDDPKMEDGRDNDISVVNPQRAVKFRKFHVNQMENVSILFADIVGFTRMSSNKSASHLVFLLNDLFGRFDRLCELTGCEKIATLGDCYYCVSGCPNEVPDHAERTVEMGRSMCKAIQQFDEDHEEEVNMRVGVHTGKVICGIVGTRRFKFDVWSNDVTLANEMESSGKAGMVHISETTYAFVDKIYETEVGESAEDIRKFKVLVEFFNKEEQCYAIKHTKDEALIKTYFVVRRYDDKPVVILPPVDPSSLQSPPSNDGPSISNQTTETPISPGSQCGPTSPLIPSASSGTTGVSITQNSDTVAKDTSINTTSESSDTPGNQERKVSASMVGSGTPMIDPRGSDVQLLEALKTITSSTQVFAFPPISKLTLNFHSNRVEAAYRRLCTARPKSSAPLTFATPRMSHLVHFVSACILLVLVVISVSSELYRLCDPSVTEVTGIVLGICFILIIFMFCVNFLDYRGWSQGARKPRGQSPGCASRIYAVLIKWVPRNILAALFMGLPSLLVLSTMRCPQHRGQRLGLEFSFVLFSFTLFTTISFWTKSMSALFVVLTTILLGVALNSDEVIWRQIELELLAILLLNFTLVLIINRGIDVSSRISFNRDIDAKKAREAITREKMQADWLLENIIPYYIMDDLRKTNKYSQHIVDAGVVFATISNFAEFYDEQYQGGQEMLRVLNEIFADFEHLLASPKYKDVEKIKTIGACFMAASGLNMAQRKHNEDPNAHLYALMDLAVDLVNTLDEFNRQMFSFKFELKVGFNIGEVTAGVIGTTKLLYDIWGDTVNVASRMYSTGEKGKIQVTEMVANRMQDRYVFEYRGEVFVKGKGDMKTYILVGKKS